MSHPPTMKVFRFNRHKRQCNIFLQGNLLDPGLFDQLLLLTDKGHRPRTLLNYCPCCSLQIFRPFSLIKFSNNSHFPLETFRSE